ncbi:tryptophan synthase subunit beta [Azotobacter chroococcum]|uniref:Tryptophan synthase subunit beta n=1 Tax=Azotobacter chroococcum TaxID=353 RepID=A0A4Q9VIT8_9GAMM|nr:tryptophan synthase subunit beta [Azotobacter chroococcum]ASL28098.1 tryptophan synthase subunit beta [Azotobacter chroococcum]NHN78733.1 tryptophan synthase subunit beta [Azotobacter chroococcum]TBW10117.1 tryptophan synthase subunit beta [Azotobacter chroococcum subsp. isscasi]TBW10929.1 tryptophan synthase subunit beta [Azotobacter chroococcum]TBW34932.1 tryptophan synthase subunit beta [Azotobacter chroococcum]
MLYVKRDAHGQLLRVEQVPFEDMDGGIDAASPEALAWKAGQAAQSSLLQLRQSDLEMIRVLEDLIYALIDKGVLRITDLPEAAQAKLAGRSRARDALQGRQRLLDEEDGGLI